MAQIGSFIRNEDGVYTGEIRTLTLRVKAMIPTPAKPSPQAMFGAWRRCAARVPDRSVSPMEAGPSQAIIWRGRNASRKRNNAAAR